MINGLLKKRASVAKREEAPGAPPAAAAEGVDAEAKKSVFGSKLRLSLSFKGARPSGSAGSSDQAGSSKATPDNPHPYEDIDSLPTRSRTQSRKSVTWKDPETNDLNQVLRARAKSVKDKDGRRTSLSWVQGAPLQKQGA